MSVDIDNLCKGALDACNKIVWRDDVQIIELIARKQLSDAPQTWIRVSEIVSFPCASS